MRASHSLLRGGLLPAFQVGKASFLCLSVFSFAFFSFPALAHAATYVKSGTVSTPANGAVSISFATPMPDANYSILLTGGTDTDSMYSMSFLNKTAGGFDIKAEDDAGANEAADNNQWAVISYGDFDFSGNEVKCGTSGGLAGNNTISFPSTFPDTNYAILANSIDDSDSPNINYVSGSKTTSQVVIRIEDDGGATEAVTSSNYCAFAHGEYSIAGASVKSGSATSALSGNTTVNFSTPFPNTSYVVIVMALSASGNQCGPEVVSRGTGSFTIHLENDAGAECAIRPFDWVAITTGEFASASPFVTTDFSSPVGAASATLHGTIHDDGGDTISEYGFSYSTVADLSSGVSTTTFGAGSEGAFSEPIAPLSNNQTYYFRAYATNGNGDGLGSIQSFTTGNTTPTRSVRLFGASTIHFYNGKIKLFRQL